MNSNYKTITRKSRFKLGNTLYNNYMEEEITQEDYQKMLKDSQEASNDIQMFTGFFSNSVMARILDLLLNNPKIRIFTSDIVEKIDISRKSLYTNMVILTNFKIVTEFQCGKKKCYILNHKNPITKHLTKLRDILYTDNAKIESKKEKSSR